MSDDEALRHEWLTPDGIMVRVVINNAQIQCTACHKWKVAKAFGLRSMRGKHEGAQLALLPSEHERPVLEIRNQPQCGACRSAASKGTAT